MVGDRMNIDREIAEKDETGENELPPDCSGLGDYACGSEMCDWSDWEATCAA